MLGARGAKRSVALGGSGLVVAEHFAEGQALVGGRTDRLGPPLVTTFPSSSTGTRPSHNQRRR
jgi:hypothetical protein